MIRFTDQDAYLVHEEEIKRSELWQFFINDHITDIVTVYDYKEKFIGIITYERLLNRNIELVQNYYIYADEAIWDNAYSIFENDQSVIYIPVLDSNKQIICFCYNSEEDMHMKEAKCCISALYDENALFINELYPQIKGVQIYEVNEMAYKFYKLLSKRKIPVEVYGGLWKEIFGISTLVNQFSRFKVMKVYAEGNELILKKKDINDKSRFDAPWVWEFLREIGRINSIYYRSLMKKEFSNIFTCIIPDYNELSNITIDEEYRHIKEIRWSYYSKTQNKNIMHQLEKIYKINYCDIEGKISQNVKVNYTSTKKVIKSGMGENRIYIIGPCIVSGNENLYNDKFTNILSSKVKDKYANYSVNAIPIAEVDFSGFWNVIHALSIKEKDIIIIIGQRHKQICEEHKLDCPIDLNLLELFNSRKETETWFSDWPIHSTGTGNRAIVDELMKKIIVPQIRMNTLSKESKCLQRGKALLSEKEKDEIYEYTQNLKKYKFNINSTDKVGAIVMNCNPMTLGHLYLIEYAKKRVDYLYIFVVEEDRFYFKFEDRYQIIKKEVEKFTNVKVIPSGRFIISSKTMPSYFNKDMIQNDIVDSSEDVEIFCEYIVPVLDISVRFAGEEPLDNITLQYNMEMKRTLTDYNLEFVEIPRKDFNGNIISASRVRKLLTEGNMEEIKKIVPDTTYTFLKKNYNNIIKN